MAPFRHIGLIVTGRGEEAFLHRFLRALAAEGDCTVEVARWIGQRSPRAAPPAAAATAAAGRRRPPTMVGSDKRLPSGDKEVGLAARGYLGRPNRRDALLVIVDDAEADRRGNLEAVFDRYRTNLDKLLRPEMRARAAVHFLMNMVEAYYFADPDSIARVLGERPAVPAGDVEQIRHPKNLLRRQFPSFDEVDHGTLIANAVDLERVLGDAETCASLRSLVGWCEVRLGHRIGPRFR